jgi:hypothetical protein
MFMTAEQYNYVVLPSAASVNCGGTERGRAEALLAAWRSWSQEQGK